MDIENKKNKVKGLGLFGMGLSIIFIMIGIHLITKEPAIDSNISPMFVKGAGIACIVFFGFLLILGVKKLFKK